MPRSLSTFCFRPSARRPEEVLELPQEFPREALLPEGNRRISQGSVIEPHRGGALQRRRQALGALLGVEHPVDPVGDDVPDPAPFQGHDRSAAGERLDRSDPEVLLPGLDEEPAGPVERSQLLGQQVPREVYGGARHRAEALFLRAAPDEDEAPSRSPGRLDRELEPLVGDERPHREEEVLSPFGAGLEKLHVHRRMNDSRLAAVVAADALGHRRGVGEVAGGTPRGLLVPLSKSPDEESLEREKASLSAREVPVELLVRVTYRGVAVAEVGNAWRRDRALGDAMRGGDDQVEAGEIERLDPADEEREILPVV